MIKEVTTFIEARAGLTRDTDLFAGHRPQGAQDNCDVVLESSGGSTFPELPERADVVFQVLSRDTTYMTARARAWVIYGAIYSNWGLGSAGWRLPLILGDSISACDAPDADWTVSAGGAKSTDLDDKKEGAGSLRNTIAAPIIATNYNTIYNPAGTWDWSARKYILFWLKSDRSNIAFTNARLYIYEGIRYRFWNLTFSTRGEWTAIKKILLTGDGGSLARPDLALIDNIQLRFLTADITAFYKKIDNVRVITEEYEIMVLEPLVTPQYIGQDEKGRYEFSTNYLMKIKSF